MRTGGREDHQPSCILTFMVGSSVSLARIFTKSPGCSSQSGGQLRKTRTWPSEGVHSAFALSSCCCSVPQSCLTLCHPITTARQASLSFAISWSLLKLMPIESVMPSNRLILCHPLLLLPSVFPSFRAFSKEPALCSRWPKYWSFSFNISPSSEHFHPKVQVMEFGND